MTRFDPSPAERFTLHIDDLTYELIPGIDVELLADELEKAMQEGHAMRVPVQESGLGEHRAFVHPSRARIIFISQKIVLVPFIGKGSG
jgi:hypothetical protein